MEKFSYLKSANADYIDELFERYSGDPNSVDESWQYFFEGLEIGGTSQQSLTNGAQGALPSHGHPGPAPVAKSEAQLSSVNFGEEAKVAELIQAYRRLGKTLANIDPLSTSPTQNPELALGNFGLTDADLSKVFHSGKFIGLGAAKLSDILARLKKIYCSSVAIEIQHIESREARLWLEKRLEQSGGVDPELNLDTRKFILKRLTESEGFERFLHTRYVAQKRFSVEGGESSIPALDCVIETAANLGATQAVLGMAHRGRLNVLTNVMHKKASDIFVEFEGNYQVDASHGEGDVKYHKGYSYDHTTRSGKKIHLSLAANPSHLEFINPVVEGMARAKIDRLGDPAQVLPILIHGDAAFAGQGVCYETLNLAHLEGYKTGGTIHIVINNQVGFTADPTDSRSTTYCTDLAKMLDAPIFHVNGDDPESVWMLSRICAEYRQKFGSDTFLDIVCYRKYGHNEGDEPSFTQPLTYKKIKEHTSTRELYSQALTQKGDLSAAESQAMIDECNARFTADHQIAKGQTKLPHASVFTDQWTGLRAADQAADLFKAVDTRVDEATLKKLGFALNQLPAGFTPHSKLVRLLEGRLKAIQEGKGIDWGCGEALTFASLLNEGCPVRVSGQDAERGTFTHRHAVLHDFETGQAYTPANHLDPKQQAKLSIYNSHLSETGVLGFEYGYSLAAPKTLTIWEAQFGDFANGAQVIIDQFIASSESKWQRMSGIALLLPHGYEGQGPEHSSARLERFLNLCGKFNMSVCNLTTPAQLFHALRRQLKRDFRKPLVIMSPKSLLRHPLAVSNLAEFSQGGFQEVIDDPILSAQGASVKKVLLCSGKIYYELLAEREKRKLTDTAIIRLEQIYPWPAKPLATLLSNYSAAKEIVWVQEEPRNMGAWQFVFGTWAGGLDQFATQVGNRMIQYAGREIGAAPAVGSHKVHEAQSRSVLEQAFGKS